MTELVPETLAPETEARKIIHVDMDAFFASVEQRDEPAYQGKPLVVGGSPQSRGVVAACSYEARKFGIHSAMPCSRAYRLCPEAIFVKPRFSAYRECSQQIHRVFAEFTELIEPLSLDEAYLDVSDIDREQGSATRMAQRIKERIKEVTGLNASAGVSYNKFLAKIASDMDKPNGLYVITPDKALDFISELPVEKFFGVGKVTAKKMHEMGIFKGADLRELSQEVLQQRFGKSGRYYYRVARGIDDRPVQSNRVRKSIGCETTFAEDIETVEEAREVLEKLTTRLSEQLKAKEKKGLTLTLKVRYNDFQVITRSLTLSEPVEEQAALMSVVDNLLCDTEIGSRPIRLLGVAMANFKESDTELTQLNLF